MTEQRLSADMAKFTLEDRAEATFDAIDAFARWVVDWDTGLDPASLVRLAEAWERSYREKVRWWDALDDEAMRDDAGKTARAKLFLLRNFVIGAKRAALARQSLFEGGRGDLLLSDFAIPTPRAPVLSTRLTR